MKDVVVDELYRRYQDIVDKIGDGEISLRLTAEETFRKSLLLAAASYFEHKVIETVKEIVLRHTKDGSFVSEFVYNKAVSRQYHTFFQWNQKNANSFFGLFGSEFKSYMATRVKADGDLCGSIEAFLEIDNERNRLVHQDYGTYSLEKDRNEIYALYKKARIFVEALDEVMEEFHGQEADSFSENE